MAGQPVSVKKRREMGHPAYHDRANLNLAINYDRLLFDGVHTQHSSLGQIDDGRSVQRAEYTTVGTARQEDPF